MSEPKTRRCAIYTRKSTDEGLEQEFNSLDAQRESCAAFILSQAHEGWENLPELYDDGGYSGGSMGRPGLAQLLADVKAGKVDVIVVYKVDRLTRSLADFAKIVEILDEAGASFVSVTQAFNTTSSMGRLTLNVLLSFAQFEREVTGERIRDKIAASKKKGMWMGGAVPLGYRVEDRKLLIDKAEAAQVKHIFELYQELKSAPRMATELKLAGYRTRTRQLKSGQTIGNVPFGKGPLSALLKNPIYIGKIVHHANVYDGEHTAIIDERLFEAVQAITRKNCKDAMLGKRSANPSPLTGMLVDPDSKPMSPGQCRKKDRRYRYYATQQNLLAAGQAAWRMSAGLIEKLVIAEIARAIQNPILRQTDGPDLQIALANSETLAATLKSSGLVDQRAILLKLKVKVAVVQDRLRLTFNCPTTMTVTERTVDADIVRKGSNIKSLQTPTSPGIEARADAGLLELIAKAFAARELLVEQKISFLVSGFSKRHQIRLARLSYLAPDIVGAILDGSQPSGLTARRMLRIGNLPLCWTEQKNLLGFS
jgi:DNA invertase Pin-like site-specific DNA recombinase